ncbi:MAG: hypothetical protein V4585_04055 [Bacteroidota bacterium]
MKKFLNSGTLAIMIFGLGPFALLLWSFGFDGESVFVLWLIASFVVKITVRSGKE